MIHTQHLHRPSITRHKLAIIKCSSMLCKCHGIKAKCCWTCQWITNKLSIFNKSHVLCQSCMYLVVKPCIIPNILCMETKSSDYHNFSWGNSHVTYRHTDIQTYRQTDRQTDIMFPLKISRVVLFIFSSLKIQWFDPSGWTVDVSQVK
jgi:hypothetical protein